MCASFCSGTRILTTRGRVRVEKLRLGDRVITVDHGPQPVQWIGHRIYSHAFLRLNPNGVPIRIQVGAIDDGVPSRNLYLSPFHNLLIDGVLIPAEALLNGSSVSYCKELDPVSYYNIEVPMLAVVLAEDMPAESYVDRGDRAMFMNTTSVEMPPGAKASGSRACAPILESGPIVDRVRARIALRAGINPPDIMERPQDGPLLGTVEWADHHSVSGWAWLPDHPDEPVVLEILDKQEVIAVALADQHRSDLRRSGIGSGCHAFHVELPRALDPMQSYQLVVRRAADSHPLPGSPFPLEAHGPSEALAGLDLAAMVNGADLCETRRVIAWLEQQAVKLHALLVDSQPLAGIMEDLNETEPRIRRRAVESLKSSKLA
ncbi:MAG TPA: Hint domain-containing protein [Acidisoma sp.]|uniref:Hint domain-containing protein n=1 Tax=Acidisoma sp. TaxID=1872115 RepID=UPI002D0F8491|nr:Hint domain-containing protein [Acidisoma sp.]HTI02942.1 Hint domain-containing protein [Acidisoma sp.]